MTSKAFESSSFRLIILLSIVTVLIFLLTIDNDMSAIGLGLWIFTFLLYIDRLGKTIPILEFMLLMATSQWILGAYFAYVLDVDHFRYYMYVEEEEYMSIIVPGTLAFILGTLIFYPKNDISSINRSIKKLANKEPKIAYYLIAVGYLLPLLSFIIPSSLRFVVYLLSNLKYVGIALLLFRENSKQKWQILFVVMVISLITSLSVGMFHDLLLWGALMFSFVALELGLKFGKKLSIFVVGLFFVLILQAIKGQYRELASTSLSPDENRIELFYNLLSDQVNNLGELFSNNILEQINTRLNQGWIISAIIDNIPEMQPFANGETIEEAISGSLVPRILNPNKKFAGGQENFERFTGLQINESSTSMGTSIIGEAYGNFGSEGSWVFMFFWGITISILYRSLIKFGKEHAIIYFLLPIIFLQVIKAETEFYVVLNHLVKSLMLIFALFWFIRRFLHWEI